MKIAVIGAGVVGICTAYELVCDGHAVTVYDKAASVAEGASFANGCQLAPSLTQALSHPQWPSGAMTAFHRFFGSLRVRASASLGSVQWLWQWSRVRSPEAFLDTLRASHALLNASLERLQAIVQDTAITFDRSTGQLVLLPTELESQRWARKLAALKDLGVAHTVLSPDQARTLEPGLDTAAPWHGAIHFPHDAVGNCRQFAQLLKDEAQRLGAQFRMGTEVRTLHATTQPTLVFAGTTPDTVFDRVVVCAGDDPSAFLAATLPRARCASVQSYSLSLPIREPLHAPRSAVLDAARGVAITRNGGRIRVSGAAELGDPRGPANPAALRSLYGALQQHFPGAANFQHGGQTWKGSSLFTGDALPLIGPSALAGVFLNVGHGHNGWGMACGAARLVADLIAHKPTAIDATPFNPQRFST